MYTINGLKKGDTVMVKEQTIGGNKTDTWRAIIVKVHTGGTIANVQDNDPKSTYYKQIFPRAVGCLSKIAA